MKMTRTTDTAKTAATSTTTDTPLTRDEVKRMLRDAAFVLHMTRRVKAEMMADRPENADKTSPRKTPELAAGLVV
jgi:hypothetical protein